MNPPPMSEPDAFSDQEEEEGSTTEGPEPDRRGAGGLNVDLC